MTLPSPGEPLERTMMTDQPGSDEGMIAAVRRNRAAVSRTTDFVQHSVSSNHPWRLVRIFITLMLAFVPFWGCSTQGGNHARENPGARERGAYLVNLLACGRCHTEGYLIGNTPTGPALAGSTRGIAYTPDRPDVQPGLAFAPNLTPDEATGLGSWSEAEIIRAMTSGVGRNGHSRLPVMPWANYTALNQTDLVAIARYLKGLEPVARQIPPSTAEGEPSHQPYVRFGIYRFEPDGSVRKRDLP